MTYVITEACVDVKDKSCIEECPVDCIYEGDRMLYIHPDQCVDCGACEPVCPVESIYYEDQVPAQWKPFTVANAEFCAGLSSPDGQLNDDDSNAPRDHPLVAGLSATKPEK
jgi:NAD-dependent dihydropyrimidine dehydrogenase PreA subunit